MDHKEKLFDQLKKDIDNDPPILNNITKLLEQFIEGLCQFCPSKENINKKIRQSFPKKINPENTYDIITKLIDWIEKFQSPADDIITQTMLKDYKSDMSINGIMSFLRKYYDHTEKVWKDTWEARKRLITGENIIPPEHRPIISGKNGVPHNMKTGRK